MTDLKITDKIARLPDGSRYFSLEFFPPKTQTGTRNLLPRLQRLAAFNPLFVTVTWGAGGSTAVKSLDLAEICASQLGLTVCLHLTCTNSSKAVIDEALTRCKELGIRNILALRGDEPRQDEYALEGHDAKNGTDTKAEDEQFVWAVDLVRYIKRHHGDYFCIGVAGYPEGWAPSQNTLSKSPEHDLPYLVEKTAAGADFIMTQLFYDVEAYLRYEQLLLNHESGVFKDVPLIPGLMPVHSWGVLTRTTKLTGCRVPVDILKRLTAVKGDDDEVKRVGVDILDEIVCAMEAHGSSDSASAAPDARVRRNRPKAFHFYTLNLEKAVAQILERCRLISPSAMAKLAADVTVEEAASLSNGHNGAGGEVSIMTKRQPINQADATNPVIVTHPAQTETNGKKQNANSEAGSLPGKKESSQQNTLSVAEGEGQLGREATWDDYPNGRWGDARSPAYGSIDGYGPSLHVSHAEALLLWGRPTTRQEITEIFVNYLKGTLSAVPWSEDSLSSETELISDKLLAITARGWWSVASQPAVDAARNDDAVVGWGPKVGGWVWQKPFVEFFLPSAEWTTLKARLDAFRDKVAPEDGVSYLAGNGLGSFEASEPGSVHPVTWGAFRGKEIITPTIIECESFRAWQEEAFGIWQEWQRLYPIGSASSRLIEGVRKDLVLVNIIGHQYQRGGALWDLLLEQ